MQLNEILTQEVVLELRERLMSYFKGDCVQSVISVQYVSMDTLPRSSQYMYERRENDIRVPRRVSVARVPFMDIEKEPNTVTFHMDAIHSCKETAAVYSEIVLFLDKYLHSVKIGESYGTITS